AHHFAQFAPFYAGQAQSLREHSRDGQGEDNIRIRIQGLRRLLERGKTAHPPRAFSAADQIPAFRGGHEKHLWLGHDQNSFQVIICGVAPARRKTICTARIVSPEWPTLTARMTESLNETYGASDWNCCAERPSALRTSSMLLKGVSSAVPSLPSGPARNCRKRSTM